MPRYDFKCRTCGTIREDVILSIKHTPVDRPFCCKVPMATHISTPPMVHWVDPVIEPFRAIATKDQPVITTTKQNREYMARNGLVDANEVVGPPPTHLDDERVHAEVQESIKAITPDAKTSARMAEQGLMDPSTD